MVVTFADVLETVNTANNKEFIKFCSDWGLIPDIDRDAPSCPKCAKRMEITYGTAYADGGIFRCYKCKTKRSIRQEAWTKGSQLPLRKIARVLAYWCQGFAVDVASSHMSDIAYNTINDWFHEFSRIAANAYVNDILAHPLGAGKVEIDESHFFKAKYYQGTGLALPQLWVFGAIDTATGRVLLEPVDKRDADTLIPIIERCILPGTLIHSDCWGAYQTLSQRGFRHETVNHSEHFTDPDTGACTNGIEGVWGLIKGWMRRKAFRRCRTTFEDHLREWGFRRNIGTTFDACWRVIAGL